MMCRLSQRALRAELVRLLKEQVESLDPTKLKDCGCDQMLDLRLRHERIKILVRELKLDGYGADQGPRQRNAQRQRRGKSQTGLPEPLRIANP